MAPARELSDRARIEAQLKKTAEDVAALLNRLESAESKELLGGFVTDLFAALADQSRREERRKRQTEGIAAARAKGVRFGRPAAPVPENFEAMRRAWREGTLSLEQAAGACGMARGTFYSAATRAEQSGQPAP